MLNKNPGVQNLKVYMLNQNPRVQSPGVNMLNQNPGVQNTWQHISMPSPDVHNPRVFVNTQISGVKYMPFTADYYNIYYNNNRLEVGL